MSVFVPIGVIAVTLIIICAIRYTNKDVDVSPNSGRNTLHRIPFEGHTYIHFRNHWSSSGDSFIHDPGCECLKKEPIKT